MQLRRFALVLVLSGLVPACSAIVNPDTTRLGGGVDSGGGGTGDGGVGIDTGIDTGMPGTDGGNACPASCDDMIACTTDACDSASGMCMHTPDNGACPGGQRCSPTMGCVPTTCTSDAECSDGNACNGTEHCTPGTGCSPGTALDCNDGVDCTTDSCSPTTGCAHATNDAACDDTIACTADRCVSDGCHHEANDAVCDTGCFSGASCQVGIGCVGGTVMTCPSDGNGCTSDPMMCDVATGMCLHPPRDDDGDGHATAIANGSPCPGGDDCDDMDPMVHPGATELCNGIDDNCNGAIDESGCLPPGPDTCATEMAISLSSSGGPGRMGMVSGSNVGDTNDYTSTCGHAGGRDAVYYVDLPGGVGTAALDITFSTDNPNTTFDTVLAATVGNTCGTGFGTARCNDDVATGTNFRSTLTVCVSGALVSTGTRVHVLVDGFDGTATGNYELHAAVSAHPGGVCP